MNLEQIARGQIVLVPYKEGQVIAEIVDVCYQENSILCEWPRDGETHALVRFKSHEIEPSLYSRQDVGQMRN